MIILALETGIKDLVVLEAQFYFSNEGGNRLILTALKHALEPEYVN